MKLSCIKILKNTDTENAAKSADKSKSKQEKTNKSNADKNLTKNNVNNLQPGGQQKGNSS